jgi:predicted ribosome quality control (RQC) complex YloA/Tae2 family protein
MTQFPDVRPVDTVSEALETFFAASEQITAHAQRRDALRQRLHEVRERLQRQHDAMSRELERAAALDNLRWEGEMIFGYMHTIEPGQSTLEVEGKTIKLDVNRTPVENAQSRFREYDKAKGAIAGVPERLAATSGQLQYLDETVAMLELADSYEAIAAIEREVQEQGILKASSGKGQARGPRSTPLRTQSSDGVPILVGRSAGQNDEVTFRLARPDDLWLHVRDIPGAHVVVQVDGIVPDRTIEQAAGLAVYFSGARNSTSAEVILTLRRHVKKVAGGPLGLVNYRNEHTIRAAPLSPSEL